MRSDMAKVVTERPRIGHTAPSLKTAGKVHRDKYDAEDHGPSKAPVSRHRQFGWDAKEFSDLLGPLVAYLRKQIGRPWNKIYSELCQNLDRRSMSGRHIWGHVKSEVKINCYLGEDGKVYDRDFSYDRSYSRGDLKTPTNRPVTGLYVHPVSGLLRENPLEHVRYTPKVDPNLRRLGGGNSLHRVDGLWYHVGTHTETATYPSYNHETKAYELKTRVITTHPKRQLNSKELVHHKLTNTPVIRPVSRRKLHRRPTK